MSIKKIENPIAVTKSTLPPFEEYVDMIKPIWKSHWLTNQGKLHQELQHTLESFFDSNHVTLCVNGHLALDVLIKALDLSGEVITTPFTFVSTTHALKMNGIKPVFCDIKMTDYTIDEDKVEQLITPKTTAILGVHVYGYPCNVEALSKIAKKHNLKLIFDAAHAFGVRYKNRSITTYGDGSMLSFHATKVFNTIEGGAVVYRDSSLVEKLDMKKNFGIQDAEHITDLGLNAKMNEFQAAMGLCNFKHLEDSINKREKIVELYNSRLKNIKGIKLAELLTGITKLNYAYYPIIIDEKEYGMDRNALFEKLAKFNVFSRKYFYPLISDCDYYKDDYLNVELPVARYIANHVLTLPLYSELSLKDVITICDIIANKEVLE